MTTLYLDYVSNVLIILASQQLLYTTTLFVLVLCVCALLKDRHPRLQMTLWLLVLLRTLVPANWNSSFNLWYLLEQWSPQVQYFIPWLHIKQLELLEVFASPIIVALPYITWSMLLTFLWFATTLGLLLRLYHQRQKFKHIIKQGHTPDNPIHQSLLWKLEVQFKLRRQVRLITGRSRVSPFTLGTLRPVIYLPKDMLENLDHQALVAVLAHEMAHVKRYDDLWGLIRHTLQCVLFFFPVIWFTNRQIDEQKEIDCDRLAVSRSQLSVGDYASSLLTIVNHFRSHSRLQASIKVPGLSLRHKSYRARLLALKHYSIKSLSSGTLALSTALLIVLFVMPVGSHTTASHTLQQHSLSALPDNLPLLSPPVQGGTIYAGFHEIDVRAPLGMGTIQVFHDGLDFQVPAGSSVIAMDDGLVTHIINGPEDGIGLTTGGYLTIEHDNGMQANYQYVGNSPLQINQRVQRGDLVGTLLRAPFSPRDFPENAEEPRVPARVHIRLRYQNVAIDPAHVIDLSQYQP